MCERRRSPASQVAQMVEVGGQAPDFSLAGTNGDVRLSELWLRGKVVLAFYTEDNTPLCSTEIGMLRDDYEVVRELSAEVVAVSSDPLESHRDFAERRDRLDHLRIPTL